MSILAPARPSESARGGQRDNTRLWLIIVITTGVIAHAWGLFRYPLYLVDEGIYTQQAWSVLYKGTLSPFTYTYDHAPAGWLLMAAWTAMLPAKFHQFGMAINSGRVLMLLLHGVSIFFLFEATRRLGRSTAGAVLAALLFSLSPLSIYYQRQVLLDNIMIFWLLLALWLIALRDGKLTSAALSGLATGIAMVTKENSVFMVPGLAYLLIRSTQGQEGRRFSVALWWLGAVVPPALYALFAALKVELFPSGLSFDLSKPPADHVSLLYSVWWQIHRTPTNGFGSALRSLLTTSWLAKDRYLLLGGIAATILLLIAFATMPKHRRNPAHLGIPLMMVGYLFYLSRSVLLDFYVTPLIPLLAMSLGLLAALLPSPMSATAVALLMAALLLIPGGYLLKFDVQGHLKPIDAYILDLTYLQRDQVSWIKKNIDPKANIIIDDDIWTDLHDSKPSFVNAHSHWKATADPAIRDKLYAQDWQRISYIVLSNKMRQSMEANNADGRENWLLQAMDSHGHEVWSESKGDVELSILKVGD